MFLTVSLTFAISSDAELPLCSIWTSASTIKIKYLSNYDLIPRLFTF
jgi:hypothetical protein